MNSFGKLKGLISLKTLIFSFCVVLLFSHGVEANCGTQGRICSKSLSNLAQDIFTVRYYFLTTSTNKVFETVLPNNGDTVLHLIDPSTGNVVCTDDDGGVGVASKIMLNVPGGCYLPHTGNYKLVIRSYSEGSSSFCTLKATGEPDAHNLPFGGRRWNVAFSQGESFQTATKGASSVSEADTFLLLQQSSGPYSTILADDQMGIGDHSKIKTGTNSGSSSAILLGRWNYDSFIFPYFPIPPQEVMIYRNDTDTDYASKKPSHGWQCNDPKDHDCDGLGNELELALQTCPCKPGSSSDHPQCVASSYCNLTHNAKDTDGDGLPDEWEVMGKGIFWHNTGVNLPMYGANPRHKDLFVELDWITGSISGNQPMTESRVREYIDAFNESSTASFLQNPDGKNGISVHVDSKGLPNARYPLSVNEDVKGSYGDWGGSAAIPQVPLQFAYQNYLDIQRRGAFRYMLLGSGSRGFTNSVPSASLYVTPSAGPNPSLYTMIHETGHVLGLQHYGSLDDNSKITCKLNYRSVMNYVYNTHIKFSRGTLPDLDVKNLDRSQSINHPEWLQDLLTKFDYQIDSLNRVDWGREVTPQYTGVVASPLVIAPSNSSCYTSGSHPITKGSIITSFNDNVNGVDSSVEKSTSSLAAFDEYAYIAYLQTSTKNVMLRYSPNGQSWNNNIVFTNEQSDSSPRLVRFDKITYPSGVQVIEKRLVILFVTSGQIRYMYLQRLPNGSHTVNVISSPIVSSGVNTQGDMIYSASVHNDKLYIFYRDNNLNIKYKVMDRAWVGWSVEKEVLDVSGNPIISDITPSPLSYPPNNLLYLFGYKIFGGHFYYVLDESTERWSVSGYNLGVSVKPDSNMAVFYYPQTKSVYFYWIDDQGFLYYHITRPDSFAPLYGSPRRLDPLQEEVLPYSSPVLEVFQSKLILVTSQNFSPTTSKLQEYYPEISGIESGVLKDWNDWELMSSYICEGIAKEINGAGQICFTSW